MFYLNLNCIECDIFSVFNRYNEFVVAIGLKKKKSLNLNERII